MRTTDFVMVLPAMYVALALRSVLPLVLSATEVFALLGANLRRRRRAVHRARRARHRALRETARLRRRGAGARRQRPAATRRGTCCRLTRGFLAVQLTLLIPAFIVAEATLSYVGLGFPDQMASWGTMLHDASTNIRVFADFPWLLSPAAAMFLVVLGLNLLLQGDGPARLHGAAPTPGFSAENARAAEAAAE